MKFLKFLFIAVFCALSFLVLYLLFAFICAEFNPVKWGMVIRAIFAVFMLSTLAHMGSFIELLSETFDEIFTE